MLLFNVPEMSCGHCVATIKKAVLSVDPAATVTADLAAKLVMIETSTAAEAVRHALADAGYESEPA